MASLPKIRYAGNRLNSSRKFVFLWSTICRLSNEPHITVSACTCTSWHWGAAVCPSIENFPLLPFEIYIFPVGGFDRSPICVELFTVLCRVQSFRNDSSMMWRTFDGTKRKHTHTVVHTASTCRVFAFTSSDTKDDKLRRWRITSEI